jgi:hypothetical protein
MHQAAERRFLLWPPPTGTIAAGRDQTSITGIYLRVGSISIDNTLTTPVQAEIPS